MFDILACMISWEAAENPNVTQQVRIEHLSCGHRASQPSIHCNACDEAVSAPNVSFTITTQAQPELPEWSTAYRRSIPRRSEAAAQQQTPLEGVLSIYGNRWTNEIIRCAFLRISTFGEIQRHTGISTNILADRLTRLRESGVLRQESSLTDGRRADYRLTARGRALFSIVLTMWEWGDRWIADRVHAPVRITHRNCGKSLRVTCRCDHCGGALKPSNARIVLTPPIARD